MNSPVKKVSILLSCFGGDDLVEAYVDFLLEVDAAKFCTLIAVNFPGSHKDPIFVEQQLKRFPDLVLLNQAESLSLYDAWNIGIESAKTRYVSNLNLDDRVSPDYYEYGVGKLDSHHADVFSSFSIMTPNIGEKSASCSLQNHLGEAYFTSGDTASYGIEAFVDFSNGRIVKRNPPHCAPIWKKSLHDEHGHFDSLRFDFAADYEFWLRCAAANKKFIISKQHKTLFYCSKGTASDRLQHAQNTSIINEWESTFPPTGYSESHLGGRHDKLHHCMNLNCVFSSRNYFNHLSDSLVSVIVVAHDHPDLLLECIASIQAQSYPLFECIVVLDNDKTNRLEAAVKDKLQHDARFLLISLNSKRERNYCRNLGLELATGTWVTLVDGDDLLPRDSLTSRIEFANRNKKDIVFGNMEVVSGDGTIQTIKFADRYTYQDLRISWPTHCMLLIRKEFLSDTRYPSSISDCVIDSSLIAGEDVSFMNELLRNNPGSDFIDCNQSVYTYRRHFSSSYQSRYNSIQQVISTIFAYHGEPDDQDLPYRNSIIKRCIGYLFWLNYTLTTERRQDELISVANQQYMDLAQQASPAQFREAEEIFLSDLAKLLPSSASGFHRFTNPVKKMVSDNSNKPTSTTSTPIKPARAVPKYKYDPHSIDFKRLYRWKNKHRGERCILMCNGPSLNKVDFSKVDTSKYILFGLNKIFLGFENLDMSAHYIAAVNAKVLDQATDVYQRLDVVKFLSNRIDASVLPQNPFTYFLNTTQPPPNAPRFSEDISVYVNEGWTVTHVALQIIYYMGFSEVNIVGMDHRFSQHIAGKENQASVIHGDDVDHFHPEYFGKGKSWDFPDLVNSEISYKAALAAFNKAGKYIFDCTINGACTIFPKRNISTLYIGGKEEAVKPLVPPPLPVKEVVKTAKSASRKICFFPAFTTADDINFSMVRAAWYLGVIPNVQITVFADDHVNTLECHDYYDPACNAVFETLKNSGQLVQKPYASADALLPELLESEIIICWKDGAYTDDLLDRTEQDKLRAAGKKIYRVGASVRMESSLYIEVSKDITAFKPDTIAECQAKFKQLLQRYGSKENAYLFATGPSSRSYDKYRYDGPGDLSIICNSVINDEEMMAAVQPDILVFADPIFHFGCSTYAKAFREKLQETCQKYSFDILIPIKYYPIFTHHMPGLKDRVIGIPHYGDKGINLDLKENFYLNTMDNILTYLMLPIGASLAKNLYVIGCDGRPLEQDDYFWGHNDKTQFSGEMQAIQKAHPSFFKTDYNEYYLGHCENLKKYITMLEDNGQQLYSMWGSHIPVLIDRLLLPPRLATDEVIISINPDLRSDFGHWAHYDRRLSETTDKLFVTLANKSVSVNPVEFFTVPTFTDDVFGIKNKYDEEAKDRLQSEFLCVTKQLIGGLDPATRLNFIMYSGDVTYIDALDSVFSNLGDRCSLSLNIFYSHFDHDVSTGEFPVNEDIYHKVLSPDYLKNRPWLKLFADSRKMQSILNEKFGVEVGFWPMVNLDINPRVLEQVGPKPDRPEKLIVFPGNGQVAKGFDISCDFIAKFGRELAEKYDCRFLLRRMLRDSPARQQMMEQKLDLIAELPFVDVVNGTLSESDFLRLFYHADFVVLPYRRQNFDSRTSSCVVNAILSGASVLVTADTWLSEQVDRFNAGLDFVDGDINAMYDACCKLLESPAAMRNHEEAVAYYSSGNILPAII